MIDRPVQRDERSGDSSPASDPTSAQREAASYRRKLEEVQSLVRVGSWEWELGAERAVWSEELRRMAELGADEPVPTFEEFVEHIHPEDRAGYLEAMREGLEKAGRYTYRHRMLLASGTEKVIETNAQVERDEEGRPARVYGATQDVTDRHRAEAALQLQADLLDQVGVAVMASNADRRLTSWNRGAEKMFGVPREEALEKTIGDVLRIPDEAQPQRMEMVMKIARGESWEGELTLYGAGERAFPALVTNAPVRDGEGKIVGYSGVIVDLTESKATNAELKRRAEEQAAIAALSRAGMSSASFEELAGQAAAAVAEMLGAEFAEVLELKADGHGLVVRGSVGRGEAAVGEETDLKTDSLAAHTLATGGPLVVDDYEGESRFSPFGAHAGQSARSGATVVIEGGEQAYGVLAAHSAERQAFSAESVEFLQSIANVLASAISRQRAQRLESQLHQNQRLEAVGQLAGGVAHDFNNLLVVILNYTEFLREQLEDDDLRGDLDEIKAAAERAAGLTHQLLVFSRREVVVPEAVDLNAVVEETESLLRHSLHEHIELVRNCDVELWKVRLGSGQAEQILINLLVNARDAMPSGGAVEIKTENLVLEPTPGKLASLKPGRYVRLTIADGGTGMEEEVAAQAFDPFFTTRKDDGGTGLGLATVYGIVKEASGYIEIYTEPGHGTAIKVYLPAIGEEEGSFSPDDRNPVAAAGETILLVEDEDGVRRLAERILAESGYSVIAARDGASARELAESHAGEIDLLLTDVVMPNLSGPQLARQLRDLRPGMKALFMSGYTGEIVSRHGAAEEGIALLEKPFDSIGLRSAVSKALHANRPGEAG